MDTNYFIAEGAFTKLINCINSCETAEQVDIAENWINDIYNRNENAKKYYSRYLDAVIDSQRDFLINKGKNRCANITLLS